MSRLFLLFAVACTNPTKTLGDLDEDTVVLADEPMLAHLSEALGDPGATVLDLFDEDLDFASAPDPSDVFAATHDAHAALPDGSGRTLSVLTYNAGLLSRRYLVFKVAVPNIDARRERVADEVFGAGHDIVFLQEVWEMDDARMLAEAGEAAGYRVWYGDKRKFHRETGLVLAVREALIGGDDTQEGEQYDAQWRSENFPGPNLKRGFLHWSFPLAGSDVDVHLFDTHLTPFYTEWRTRNLQVRQLGLAIAEVPDDALVLVGGDMNAGWHYPRDLWVDAEGEEHPGWFRNTTMPALLAYYGGLEDLANAAELAMDPVRGADIPEGADSGWLDTPYGDASLCDAQDTYTATDCNHLYLTSYAATEFPARMDLLWVRDGTGRVRARSRELAFVQPLDFSGTDAKLDEALPDTFELSDHYGQQVTLEILD
ncbi:MAG: endonuclease/exonuclease/phosphatase family protein [Myxococcota bacterium]